MTWDITTVTTKSTTTIKTAVTIIPKTIITIAATTVALASASAAATTTTDYFSFKLIVAVFSHFLYMTHFLRKHVFVKVKVAYIISFIRRMGIQLSY